MQAGALRHLVLFARYTAVRDSDGRETAASAWLPLFNGQRQRAEIHALSGRELIAAAAINSKVSTRLHMRWKDGITAGDRAVGQDGTTYNIEAVIPDPHSRVRGMTLLCSSGPHQG